MTFDSLVAIRTATRCEFVPELARQHHFVRLLNGRWCRTLGPPGDIWTALGVPQFGPRVCTRHVRGNIWHQEIEED